MKHMTLKDAVEKTNDKTLTALLYALEVVAFMDVEEQFQYFKLNDWANITNNFEGLYAVIDSCTPEEIFEGVQKYYKAETEKETERQKKKVLELADEIGIHNLYSIVKDLRGE